MKIVLSKILWFQTFFEEISDKNLPIQTLYKIFKIKKKSEEVVSFYQENFQKIILECAILDERGNPKTNEQNDVLIDNSHVDECAKRLSELTECLIDFPDVYFNLSEFENIQLTLRSLEAISPLIIE